MFNKSSKYFNSQQDEHDPHFKRVLLCVAATTRASAKHCWLKSKRAAWWTRSFPQVNNICGQQHLLWHWPAGGLARWDGEDRGPVDVTQWERAPSSPAVLELAVCLQRCLFFFVFFYWLSANRRVLLFLHHTQSWQDYDIGFRCV